MTQAQINTEIKKITEIKNSLLKCVKDGKTEYYKDYIDTCTYLLKLNQLKPKHNLSIA